jgi:hypothetical protein
MSLVRSRAILLWRLVDDEVTASDIALRARRGYDRLGELGITVAADSTREGIEVTVPLSRAALALKILADRSILPDAVLVGDTAADHLRTLRRDIGAYRGRVELVIGHEAAPDAIAELRSRVRSG